jgi:biotin operon repressor
VDLKTIVSKMSRVLLEAEVNPKGRHKFEEEYERASGDPPNKGDYYQHQPNKYGAELRIYFEAPASVVKELKLRGYHIEQRAGGYRSNYPYRINDNSLFFKLVELGLRLGENVP